MKRLLALGIMVTVLVFALAPITALAAGDSKIYEAENGEIVKAGTNTEHEGYSGSGFTDLWNDTGTSVTFKVEAAAAGESTINIRYANGQADARTLSLYVNDTKVKQLSFPVVESGNWKAWGTISDKVTLNAGSNTIKIQKDEGDNGQFNLDYIEIVSEAAAPKASDTSASSQPEATAQTASEPAISDNAAESNPKTGDMGVIIYASSALISTLGFIVSKKLKNK